ncbi:hypothetical protein FRB94_003807 [Tulasnella sp. JGI-2019a]|nr:hypothetical protein FRB94_003807 [Tulasnella sp. JGI-2019a]KAG8993922.1 hypothetical protein FRB93_001861 [Tulasnella sp. JGI-2019a]KAG9033843.1 hypothetical protein FRB95_014165 [Tulasnella sp. JGI-2019a]
MKMEQIDRKFYFTVTISATQCRVWRWDSAGCHVSEAIDFANSPQTFIHLIGQLASMDPASLGYDEKFSNAGTVLASEVSDIPTTLTISPSVIEHRPRGHRDSVVTPDISQPQCIYLLDSVPIYQARDLLFDRSTTVWTGRLVEDGRPKSARHIIVQKWQDDTRISEAWFCSEANEVGDRVATMGCSQELDSTHDYRRGLIPKSLWVYTMEKPTKTAYSWSGNSGSNITAAKRIVRKDVMTKRPKILHERSLLRLVFTDIGVRLHEAANSEQLLLAVLAAVQGLQKLWEQKNMIHCDLSVGNILLNMNPNANPDHRGFVIDLGVASYVTPEALTRSNRTLRHHHLTGTLPFMAIGLPISVPTLHQIHHDLESVFWVTLIVCLQASKDWKNENTPNHEPNPANASSPRDHSAEDGSNTKKGFTAWLEFVTSDEDPLRMLETCSRLVVRCAKFDILSRPETNIKVHGPHAGLHSFLVDFARACHESHSQGECQSRPKMLLTFEKVIELLQNALRVVTDTSLGTSATAPLPSSTISPARHSLCKRSFCEFSDDGLGAGESDQTQTSKQVKITPTAGVHK